jgi:cytochrome c biogenesis protein
LEISNLQSDDVVQPQLGLLGWARWTWRQLTSMRTALILLLMLAVAAVPGSVYPQRSADPNGVKQFFDNNGQLAEVLDFFQLFDVYTSVWFSAIYILLFISLIGCVVPRTFVHARALREPLVKTPTNLKRMPAFAAAKVAAEANQDLLQRAKQLLKNQGYRVELQGSSVSAERGFLRETGNLVFHLALIGVLIAVGFGGGNSFSGQRVIVEGETFVNNLAGYDSLSPGTFFSEEKLVPFSVSLDKFEVDFDLVNQTNIGMPLDFRAFVTANIAGTGEVKSGLIRVNEPLELPGANLYLTGNGYAPVLTFKDPNGNVTFSGATPFLPQDSRYTSLGVIKVPDAAKQFGAIAFFYPTVDELESGALTSLYPAPVDPMVTMNIYVGDLGLDASNMTQVAGGKSGTPGLRLKPGETAELPNKLGTVTFDGYKRYASLDISYNPGGIWVLLFALLALAGVALSLLVPRRRVWVKQTATGFEAAALARGDDPALEKVVAEIVAELKQNQTKKKDD